MNLEDHIGDIIRKARMMSGASRAAAAEAAGWREEVLAALEESGKLPQQPNWSRLASTISLHPAKLESIARGWTPPDPDLSTWRELRVITSSDGEMAVNAYLIWDEATRDAALFDTGWDAGPILDIIRQERLQLRHLFITHTHADHIAALDPVVSAFPRVRLHSSSKSAPVDQRNRPNEIVQVGNLRVSHRDTPGHAEDGTTYVVGNWPEDGPYVAIVGDAIFAGSMGRGNQSWELARQKVRENILSLPSDTLICPGHGPLTTVILEKENNPFF